MNPTDRFGGVVEFENVDHVCMCQYARCAISSLATMVAFSGTSPVLVWPQEPLQSRFRCKRHTKVHHIKDPTLPAFTDSSHHRPLIARRHAHNRLQRRPVVLDELDTDLLLLPQLQVPVNRCSYDKAGPGMSAVALSGLDGARERSLGHGYKVDGISVHERLVVPVLIR